MHSWACRDIQGEIISQLRDEYVFSARLGFFPCVLSFDITFLPRRSQWEESGRRKEQRQGQGHYYGCEEHR